MANQRRGGIISLAVGGVTQDVHGQFTYGLGQPKREAIVGPDGVHGFKELPQVGFIEGEIVDSAGLDVAALFNVTNQTVTLALANGKTVMLNSAYYAGDGTAQTEEGLVAVRFEGTAQEVA